MIYNILKTKEMKMTTSKKMMNNLKTTLEEVGNAPCENCSFRSSCESKSTDCFAFRTWSNKGTFRPSQMGRLIRNFDLLGA